MFNKIEQSTMRMHVDDSPLAKANMALMNSTNGMGFMDLDAFKMIATKRP